ncbi:RNA polymerase sigma factor [Pseudoxanthomonas beigongshangi]
MDGFTRVFVRERQRIVHLVRRIVGCDCAAEDIAQDTYLRLKDRNLDEADLSLVFRTAQNLALDHLRSRRVRRDHAHQAVHDTDTTSVSPEQAADSRARLDGLLHTLRGLPPRTRRVFLMQRVDGCTYPQIGKALGVSTSTVEKEMMLAMHRCRDFLRRQAHAESTPPAGERCTLT